MMEALTVLPHEIQRKWRAILHRFPDSRPDGVFRLVEIRPTGPGTWQELKIIVLVLDQEGQPIPGVKVAFSFSTAGGYIIDQDFTWTPPSPQRALVEPTQGSGEIDCVQGSVINEGEPGGMTVYCLDPEFPSDHVAGCGALRDHTGLYLIFQLQIPGHKTVQERLDKIEAHLGLSL
jgi:hypothetical protein